MISGREISIVIPVLNEKNNINCLLSEMDSMTSDYGFSQIQEVIFVDDGSSDGTVEAIKSNMDKHNYLVKVVERNSKLGTVNATITGCNVATSEAIVVMDGDLQHPPHVIIEMARRMHDGYDLIVASRHVTGGRNMWKPLRGVISRVAIFISHLVIPSTRAIKDPTSGFFMARKDFILKLSPLEKRAKILLYVLSSFPAMKTLEIPYTFVDRKNGTSKIVGMNIGFITGYLIEVIGYMKLASHYRTTKNSGISNSISNVLE